MAALRSLTGIILCVTFVSSAFAAQRPSLSDAEIRAINEADFNNADLDGSGTLDFYEFDQYKSGTYYDALGAFRDGDGNGDGQLTLAEFEDAITTEG